MFKCPGCRCLQAPQGKRCPCCGSYPAKLICNVCGQWGDLNTMVLTTCGPTHDHCLKR